MRVACPGCGAEESRCREVLPRCRKLAADQRRLYASANGSGVDESPALRSRVSELEAALREACEVARARDTQRPWCRYCGREWSSADHLAGPCRIGRGLGVLGEAGGR